MTCTRGTPALQAAAACCAFDSISGVKPAASCWTSLFELGNEHLPNELAAVDQAVLRGHEDQLDGLQLLGDRHRDAVGVHAIGLAVAVEAERRDDRHDALREQRLQQLGIDALDLAGEEMVDALEDAHRMGDDDVRAGRAEIVGREAFEDFVRQPVGRGQREVERRRIGDARAVEVGGVDMPLARRALESARTRRGRAPRGCSATRAARRRAAAWRSCRP